MKNILKFFISSNEIKADEINKYNIKNILIVKQHNQLGDMLCTFPMFASLRNKYPNSFITLVASPENIDIVNSSSEIYFDKIILYDKKHLLKFYRDLKKNSYDMAIVPSTVAFSETSHLIAFMSGAKIRIGVASADGRKNEYDFLLNIKRDFDWDKNKIHQTKRFLDIAAQIGCLTDGEDIDNASLHQSESEYNIAENFFKNNFPIQEKLIIGFHPGAGKPANRWNLNNFFELIKSIYNIYNCYILITSGKMDTEIIKQLKEKLINADIQFIIAENFSIREISAIISKINLYITNDTGTMHTAVYSGAPLIALFGPTPGWEWGPTKNNQIYIQSKSNDINDITVNDVINKVNNFLTSNKFK